MKYFVLFFAFGLLACATGVETDVGGTQDVPANPSNFGMDASMSLSY